MTKIQFLTCLWLSGFVHSELQFLERREGESVVLPCVVEQRDLSPFGVYLKRSWLQPSKVLFMYTNSEVSVNDGGYKTRVSVSGDPGHRALNVTLSELRVSDTDRYYCEFFVNRPSSEDERIHGHTEFFLLVTAGGHCGCSSYSTLLYALSSAVALLLLLLAVVGFVLIYQGKARRRSVKSRPQAPIYEEMAGVQPLGRKVAPRHLEETEASEYRNCLVKKSCNENQYESPSVAFSSRG
ncbi:Hypothetical protein SMAX5B_007499 [Scophthalmus maximus]|uniref:Ig-like domain-containing protein n=1 Tax=Scophthalmus maximus TaxID=52904 RepID=A0A2U9BQB1_SCOMX|nr:Hypothetical protein SMAX5B_007499 [Scophthalmus maximus]